MYLKTRTSLVSLLCLCMALLLASCTAKNNAAAAAGGGQMPAMPVKVRIAAPTEIPDYTEYMATLESRSASILQPDQEGMITKILVKSGDQVKAGDLLFQIDPIRQEATVNSQEANRRARQATLDLAKKELERRKGLYAAGVIAKQDLDQAQSAYDAAQGDLESVDATVHEQKV